MAHRLLLFRMHVECLLLLKILEVVVTRIARISQFEVVLIDLRGVLRFELSGVQILFVHWVICNTDTV